VIYTFLTLILYFFGYNKNENQKLKIHRNIHHKNYNYTLLWYTSILF